MGISAHDLVRSVDCKTPHCPNEADVTRGRYANLCRSCREQVVRGQTPSAPALEALGQAAKERVAEMHSPPPKPRRPRVKIQHLAGGIPRLHRVFVDDVEWSVAQVGVVERAGEPVLVTLAIHPSALEIETAS